jgi:predicted TIM-barrel fold metal-dependent hydrolase
MIIDFRVRPPFRSFTQLTIFNARLDAPNRPAAWVGPVAESTRQRDLDLFTTELHEAGVRHAVIWGRSVPDPKASTSSDDIVTLVSQQPRMFSGFGGLQVPSKDTIDATVAQAEDILINKRLKGVTLEPGFAMSPTGGADDPHLLPVLKRCEELGAIVALTISVRAGSDIRFSNPEAVDRIAGMFPKLRFVVGHSFWPWVAQACGVAYRRSNVFLLPDFYGIGCPGHQQWVEAANTLLERQIIFGSAYPLAAVGPMVKGYRDLPFRPAARERVMWGNAADLLGLSKEQLM